VVLQDCFDRLDLGSWVECGFVDMQTFEW